jgi:hypothetical protein
VQERVGIRRTIDGAAPRASRVRFTKTFSLALGTSDLTPSS